MALFVCCFFSSINKELSFKLKNKSPQNKNIRLKRKSKPPLFESMVFKNAPLNNVKQCRGQGMATVLSTTLVFSNWNLFTGHWFVIE